MMMMMMMMITVIIRVFLHFGEESRKSGPFCFFEIRGKNARFLF